MKRRANMALAGAFLVHLALGSVYCWGNFTTYYTSWLVCEGKDTDYDETNYAYACGVLGMGIGALFLSRLERIYGCRLVCFVGGSLLALGEFSASWSTDPIVMICIYGLLSGTGIGMAYSPALACATRWFPHNKGFANGVVMGGFGFAALVWNLLGTDFMNSNSVEAECKIDDEKYFCCDGQSSTENAEYLDFDAVPVWIRVMAGAHFGLVIVGSLMMSEPPVNSNYSTSAAVHQYSTKEAFSTKTFKLLWLCFFLTATPGVFTMGAYKTFGNEFIDDDYYLSIVGSITAVIGGSGRIVWGFIADKIGFKLSILIFGCVEAVAIATYSLAQNIGDQYLFLVWTCVIIGAYAGNFVAYPLACSQLFGTKYYAENYGALFTAFAIAGFGSAVISDALRELINFSGLFILMGCMAVVGVLLSRLLPNPAAPEPAKPTRKAASTGTPGVDVERQPLLSPTSP
eukprot:TRINITY_DN4705_c0_g1_i1.p1 TRINITY_DN4705_c0_g1~~TRINITY_DN4705_c0_g1_i1.p1  ORF type:complete len:478 (-),score=108.35 TRINITY_DN4705_c0_g1_i1:52-1425(-)